MVAYVPGPPQRADARRNYDAIVRVAEEEVDAHGAAASLEAIARRAGVGSATLHRHFPSRWALLQAVFHGRVEALCSRASELGQTGNPDRALIGWLTEVAVYGATTRGLAHSLTLGNSLRAMPADGSCEELLASAGDALLKRAHATGSIRDDTNIHELLGLVNAISMTAEGTTNAEADAARLATLAFEGIRR